MNLSPEARAAEKKAQLARLAAKGTPGYVKMYASQPAEIRKGEIQRAARKVERDKKNAASVAAISAAQDAVAVFKPANITTKKGAS